MSKNSLLENVLPRETLGGLSRIQSRDVDFRTVKPSGVQDLEQEGWITARENKASVRMQREKSKSARLEARVWSVLYRMGFPLMSGSGGGSLILNSRDPKSPKHQIDAIAIDDEAAIAIECKSYQTYRKDSSFSEKLAKHAGIRRHFADAVNTTFPHTPRRHVATIMVVWDLNVRENDRKRAVEAQVLLLDEQELQYYEGLVKHLGQAARFQLLADAFRGRKINGLEIKVPALRAKIGKLVSYTFSLRPDYLLKVAYIAHRAKGKAIDLDAYQRMLSKSRLKNIGEFISEGGIFPTNVVVNLEDTKQVRFDRGKHGDNGGAGGVFGWLTLSPSYGSAWVIDGQHRLFGYSGHDRAESSFLNVLAFEGLTPAKQTELFVSINSQQRKVPKTLLVELDATLKWEDPDEKKRVHAIISKACMGLDTKGSPLAGRVLLSDVRRTKTKCITLTALSTALSKPGLFIMEKRGFRQYGPLWRAEPTACLRRTLTILEAWLGRIAEEAEEWWVLGQDEGGGLAMNDGVTVCLNMLRSVLEHLNRDGNLGALENQELTDRLEPFADAVGKYFARMTEEQRKNFRRDTRGGQGQDAGTNFCKEALQAEFASYQPDGLKEWIQKRKSNSNARAQRIINDIERVVQKTVIEMLREEFDLEEDSWWWEGVPENIRLKIASRIQQAGGGVEEEFFDFLHYENIIKANWSLFKMTFAYGPSANVSKEKGTGWLREISQWRNKVMHSSRRDFLGLDDLARLVEYQEWLEAQVKERNII